MQDYEIWPQETRTIALSYGVEISTDYCFILSQCTRLTDRRTDRRRWQDRAYALQSHGKNQTTRSESYQFTSLNALQTLL